MVIDLCGNPLPIADQNQLNILMRLQDVERCGDCDSQTIITSHGINGESSHLPEAVNTGTTIQAPLEQGAAYKMECQFPALISTTFFPR